MSPLFADMIELNALQDELAMFENIQQALTTHGFCPSTRTMLTRVDLMSSVGMEAFTSNINDNVALEGLGAKVAESMKAFAGKVISVVKSGASKISDLLGPIVGKITDKFKTITALGWAKIQATGHEMKAHPYKTVGVILAAALVVAGIAMYVASGAPGAYANESAFTSFRHGLVDKIKGIRLPFGKVAVKATDTIIDVDVSIAANAAEKVSGSARVLGWGKEQFAFCVKQVTTIATKLKDAFMEIFAFVGKVTAPFHKPIEKFSAELHDKVVGATGNKYAGMAAVWAAKKYYYQYLFKAIGIVYRLIKAIVMKAFEWTRAALFGAFI